MTSQQLPERPNLEQLKNQAKTLLRAAHAQDSAALARFRILPSFGTNPTGQIAASALALHDAQSVIAREHGFASWTLLREAVEERTLTFAAAVNEFIRSATGGASGRARRLLALHPGIAKTSFHAALILGDTAAVQARLDLHPSLAKERGGPLDWEPIQYVCQSCLFRGAPEQAAGLAAVARFLLARGANPNAFYTWQWHPELPRTVLWGAVCTVGNLPLAQALLDAGADPTDGVTMQIVASGSNTAALDLLLAYGANLNGIPGGVPPLRYILGYGTNPTGPRWLLEHGADANLAWGEFNEAPIHVAARRWDVSMVELLARHGADLRNRRSDGQTAHTLAELNGNHAIAKWLLEHGVPDELSDLERLVAACARGDRAAAEAKLQANPDLSRELKGEHHLLLHGAAQRGDAAALEAMLACGFDPRVGDKDRVTPLHRAAMAGRPECVRLLLEHGASPKDLDGMFSAPPLVWAVEGWSHPKPGADHVAVARLLIAAGSPDWNPPEAAPQVEGTLEKLAELRRASAEVLS